MSVNPTENGLHALASFISSVSDFWSHFIPPFYSAPSLLHLMFGDFFSDFWPYYYYLVLFDIVALDSVRTFLSKDSCVCKLLYFVTLPARSRSSTAAGCNNKQPCCRREAARCFNSTIRKSQSSIIGYFGFIFTAVYNGAVSWVPPEISILFSAACSLTWGGLYVP